MTTLEVLDNLEQIATIGGNYLHIYKVGIRRPTIGDVAICGYRKKNPTVFSSTSEAEASGRPRCPVCYR